MRTPVLFMMVGLPASGKSTVIETLLRVRHSETTILSTDNYLEKMAQEHGSSYDAVFSNETMKADEEKLQKDLKFALRYQEDIVWDQTNLTVKSRAKKLAQIPIEYERIAVVVTCDPGIREVRLNHRPGKTIPPHVIKNMVETYQQPTKEEGFHHIFTVRT